MTGPVPFQCIQPCDNILFAARGADIHAFSLHNGSHLSTWSYPATEPDTSSQLKENVSVFESTPTPEAEPSAPPAKRTKTEKGDEGSDGRIKKKRQKPKPKSTYFIPDQPIISLLVSTTDGKHLVAVTSHDKVVRVLEHDGKGNLKALSQRTMPKRPCSIILTPDNRTILSADKFGDVYSLPLTENRHPAVAPSAGPEPRFKTTATPLTVHTARNLVALENQKLHLSTQKTPKDSSILSFDHTLLLGHVSMLTAISLAKDSRGRAYIISADRDEHIRISRGPPQSHIIETFCLGHKEFISHICVPGNRPELLVSGGGDEELFLWNWLGGAILARQNLLIRVQEVVPDAKKVAVSGLRCAFQDGSGDSTIAVTCERVPAVFIFKIGKSPLIEFKRTISLSGNPLDFCFFPGDTGLLVVALDLMDSPDPVSAVLQIISSNGPGAADPPSSRIQPVKADPQTLPTEELRKLLYTTEHLRKSEEADGGGAENGTTSG